MELIRAVWRFRGFVAGSVRRELTARYGKSMLGGAWAALSPLAMMAVYLVVFSQLMQGRLPGVGGTFAYGIFLCAGLLLWGLFAEIVQRCMTMFIDNAGLLKKMSFPRSCLPVIVLSAAIGHFVVAFLVLVLLLALIGHAPAIYLIAAPVPVLLVCLIAISLGIVLGVLNVFFRDVSQLFGTVLQAWFWLTPVVYPLSALPQAVIPWVGANPLTPVMDAMQRIVLGSGWPHWNALVAPLLTGLVMAALALLLFRRRAGELVDEL